MAEQNEGFTSPIPESALTATGPFFGGAINPKEEPVKIENPLENLDLERLQTYLKNNPSTWQQLGYGPKGVFPAEPEGFKTYADPDAAIGRYVYEELIGNPSGTYDALFGVGGEKPMLPRDALAAMSQYRNVTGIEAFKEQLPRYLLTSAAGLGFGASTIPTFGGNMLLAGSASILGSIAADTGFRIFSPDSPINQPYLPGTNAETGEFISGLVGGGAPFLGAPWTIPARQQITLGTNAIGRNLQRWRLTGGERIPEALRRIDDAYVESMRTAREAPRAFLTSEGTALGVSGLAGTAAMQLPDETPGKGLIVFGSELFSPMLVSPSAVLNSASYLKQRGTELFGIASAPLTEEGRTRGFVDALTAAMLEVQNITDPQEADAYIKRVVENLRAADPRLTSGLAGDDPVLKILENRLVGRNQEVTAMYTDANRVYNSILDGLRLDGNPEALQLRADLLLARDQEVIWQTIADRYDEYNRLRDTALRSNSDFDDGKEFRNFFLNPDTGLLADIRRQRRLLREAIPRDTLIDSETIKLLTDEYARIKNRLTVGDAEGRLSSGRDLVSLDQAFRSITPAEVGEEAVTSPAGRQLREEGAKLQTQYAQLNEEIKGLNEKKRKEEITPVERARLEEAVIKREGVQEDIKAIELQQETLRKQEEPVDAARQEGGVTSGELLVLLSTLDQAIGTNNFRPDGNELLTNALDELRAQTLDVLRITDNRVRAAEIEQGVPTASSLALSDYLAFEEASSNVFSNTFLGEIRRKVSPEKASSALFDSFTNTPLIRLQQLDEAVNLLNTFNAERSGALQLRVDEEARRRENLLAGMDPATRTRAETLEQAIDDPSIQPGDAEELPVSYGSSSAALSRLLQGQSFTPGQLQRMDELITNPESSLMDLRAMEEKLLRGFLRNGEFWERVPRMDPETGKPIVRMVNIPGSDRQVAEEVVDYLPTEDFYSFLEDNKQAIQQFFPSVYADMMDTNMANQAIKAAIGEIPTKSASDRNAFFQHMMIKADEKDIPEYRSPNALVNTIVGAPGTTSDVQRTNAHVTLRSVIDDMFDGVDIDTPEGREIRDGFLQAVFNNASIYSNDPAVQGIDGINAPAYFDYLFQPINAPRVEKPGADTRSVMNILLESGLIDQEHYLNIRRTTEAFKELENLQQGRKARFEEFGGLTGEEAEQRFAPGFVGKLASGITGSFLLGVGGSAIGTRLYNLFTGGIAGPGSIRAAGTGVEALRNLFTNLPITAQEKMYSDMFTDKEVLATALEMYNNPEKLDELLTADRIGTLYTWFAGAGLQMSPSEFFAEFGKEYLSPEDEAELQARENRAEAIRTRGRQPSESPFAVRRPVTQQAQAPAPVAPPPVAQAPMPMPQAPAPTAPASPASRQQFAAAFPFDVTSDVIRSQGIGSLGRTG